ncbi:MAG: hypothetical protein ABS81_12650 [Pseudonocardia sp. SCN 72-86]|nr:MAG: hypothetical protein ABS81_12650 [Pseudonocardia sp. SCN 72-86]
MGPSVPPLVLPTHAGPARFTPARNLMVVERAREDREVARGLLRATLLLFRGAGTTVRLRDVHVPLVDRTVVDT